MKTAMTVAKGILAKDEPDNRFFDKAHIHIHVPEVAGSLFENKYELFREQRRKTDLRLELHWFLLCCPWRRTSP